MSPWLEPHQQVVGIVAQWLEHITESALNPFLVQHNYSILTHENMSIKTLSTKRVISVKISSVFFYSTS